MFYTILLYSEFQKFCFFFHIGPSAIYVRNWDIIMHIVNVMHGTLMNTWNILTVLQNVYWVKLVLCKIVVSKIFVFHLRN